MVRMSDARPHAGSSVRAVTRPLGLALVLATAFGAWEIFFAGFMADDLMQLGILERVSPAAAWTGPFDLYTISDGDPAHVRTMQDAGLFPWFVPPAFEMSFLRPLSSATLVLDHALFGLHPAGYRLDGVLWSLALVAMVGVVFRRVLPGRIGTIALIVFVVSGIQSMFCWSATRHVVIAAALGFAALAAHLRWRADAWWPGAVLSVVALASSLAASEVGVSVAVYLLAYEALVAPGAARMRLRAASPALAVLATYLLAWRLLARGVSPGVGYIDPLREPGTFLLELPARLAVLLGGLVTGGNVDFWVLRPDFRPVLVAAGALATLGFAVLLRAAWRDAPAMERRAVRWLGAATVASAIPFAGTPIGARCLLVPFVGAAALIAVVIVRWWTAWRAEPRRRRRVLVVACAALAGVHLGLAPIGRLAAPVLLQRMMTARAAAAIPEAELDPRTVHNQTVVVLVAPDLVVGLHGAFHQLLYRRPMPARWRVLSWAPARHRFVRTGSDTLQMQVAGGAIESAVLRPGRVVRLRGMEATVLAAGAVGPSRIRFHFDRPLDDPSLTFLAWNGGRLRRVPLPPVGGTILVPFGGAPRIRRH
jgi:hypothetical protein